jgi:salicylate hydroxylase
MPMTHCKRSSSLQSNGLRVLDLIPGLVSKLPGHQLNCFKHLSILPEDEGSLMQAQTYAHAPEAHGYSPRGVNRGEFHRTLVQAAVDHGISIHYGHQLVSIEQGEDSVKVGFSNGTFVEGSFVVGCDGLHSNTRSCLIGDVPADFTGLTQVRPRHILIQVAIVSNSCFKDGWDFNNFTICY